ncbi:MAG: CoA transferase [Planctomycetota bacterium]
MQPSLTGVRILDLSRMLSGDFGSILLGDSGAEIIKIEDPDGGDPLRQMPPHFLKGESAYFLSINRNKKSITLDLTKEKGRAIFYELVKKSDVVFDNFRPGILEKLGADYETIKKHNPKIISCSISSYGATGPYKDLPGFDLVIQALSGAMSFTGEPGREPVRMGIPMGDLAGSLYAVYAISTALYAREKTGQGQRIDLSLLDCLVSLLTYVAQYYFIGNEISQPIGSGHMSVVPYRVYQTKDGHLTVAVFVEKFWGKLCESIGLAECADDPKYCSTAMRLKNRDEVNELLGKKFRTETTDHWIKKLSADGIPAAPVNTVDQVFSNPQVLHRKMVVEINHPKCGKYKMLGHPIKTTGCPDGPNEPPPLLGEHTEEILDKLLGYRLTEIEQLKKDRVI